MSSLMRIELPQGSIGFSGTVRCWDDMGHEAYEIALPNHPIMFGEWDMQFAENKTDFDVAIVSFGYLDKTDIANTYSTSRQYISKEEIATVKELLSPFLWTLKLRNLIRYLESDATLERSTSYQIGSGPAET